MSLKAVLFDIDGTLIDSNDLHAEAWQAAMAHFGQHVPLDAISEQIGKGGDNLLPALLPQDFLDAQKDALDQYRSELFTRDYLERVRPFPDVRRLFERLKLNGLRIVLASSGTKEEVAHHLELIECEDLVVSTTSTDDAEHSKPDPDIFVAALKTLGDVEADEAAVVGDSPYDMIAAAKIGLRRIGVLCGGFSSDWLRDTGAEQLFDDPADLLARLDQSLLVREDA